MVVLICIVGYVAAASAAMFFGVKLNRNLDGYKSLDDGRIAVIAAFWPVAFPVFAAYAISHLEEDRHE